MSKRLFSFILVFMMISMAIIANGRSPHLAAQEEHASQTPPEPQLTEAMRAFLEDRQDPLPLAAMPATPCVGGMAGPYPCSNVDLLAFMPLSDIGGGSGNDIWGWTDPLDNTEYAIMGRSNGTAFVDLSDPENPVYLGDLPSHAGSSSWRDIKTYANHAFIVSDSNPGHGMQVFDLTQLRNVTNPPVTFSETAHYSGVSSAHNVVIDEASGFAYIVGANCSGGLHIVDISTPTSPTQAGCFSSDGYTHDAQCLVYNGPDTAHQGSEICFNANEDTLTIVDVTDKSTPAQLSRTGYAGSAYTHQGWLTDDHTYFLLDDELDESSGGHNTRTYIWDVSDLDNPSVIGSYTASTPAIDHNQYVKGDFVYQSNYRAGFRILDITDVENANLTEAAYFDIYPSSDSPSFNGSWSNYPYFDSGIVIVSGIEQGLFILQPTINHLRITKTAAPAPVTAGGTLTYTMVVQNDTPDTLTGVTITDVVPLDTTYIPGSASHGGSETGGIVTFPAVTLNSGDSITRTFQVMVSGTLFSTEFFFDDFESGFGSWTMTGLWNPENETDTCGAQQAPFPSSSNAAYYGQDGVCHYDNGSTNSGELTMNTPVMLTGTAPDLIFSSYEETEGLDSYDVRSVDISTDGGSSWNTIAQLFTEETWYEATVALSAYVGENILIRFQFDTVDSQFNNFFGWLIDDVQIIEKAKIFNTACVSANEGNFACDEVETVVLEGDTPVYDVTLSPDMADAGWAGTTVTYTAAITNAGNISDTFDLTLSSSTWPATLSTNTIFLNQGENATFTVNVEIPAGASHNEMDTVTITATSTGDPSASDTATLTTTAMAAVYSVAVGPDTEMAAAPGTTITYTLYVTNTGTVTDTFDLTTSSTWTTTVGTTSLTLGVGSSAPVWVVVEVPLDALGGTMDTAVFTATSQSNNAVSDTASLTTTATPVYALQLNALNPAQSGPPGTTLTYTINLTNTGSATETYTLTADGIWTATPSITTLTLAPGATTTFWVGVQIPPEAANGSTDTTTVAVTSENMTTGTILLTTTADSADAEYTIYLPFLTTP